jgi:hypothetical protein
MVDTPVHAFLRYSSGLLPGSVGNPEEFVQTETTGPHSDDVVRPTKIRDTEDHEKVFSKFVQLVNNEFSKSSREYFLAWMAEQEAPITIGEHGPPVEPPREHHEAGGHGNEQQEVGRFPDKNVADVPALSQTLHAG